jgi:hypothetical protein
MIIQDQYEYEMKTHPIQCHSLQGIVDYLYDIPDENLPEIGFSCYDDAISFIQSVFTITE